MNEVLACLKISDEFVPSCVLYFLSFSHRLNTPRELYSDVTKTERSNVSTATKLPNPLSAKPTKW